MDTFVLCDSVGLELYLKKVTHTQQAYFPDNLLGPLSL